MATLVIEYPLGIILPEILAKSLFFYITFTIKLFLASTNRLTLLLILLKSLVSMSTYVVGDICDRIERNIRDTRGQTSTTNQDLDISHTY